jgi:hypothetical protein
MPDTPAPPPLPLSFDSIVIRPTDAPDIWEILMAFRVFYTESNKPTFTRDPSWKALTASWINDTIFDGLEVLGPDGVPIPPVPFPPEPDEPETP